MENDLVAEVRGDLRAAALIAASNLIASSSIASQQVAKPAEVVKLAVEILLASRNELWPSADVAVQGIQLEPRPRRPKKT